MVWLVWRLAKQLWSAQAALWSSLVFATMALTYISAGAVMTDAFLALGTTLTLVSFCLVMSGEAGPWRWLFFIGLVIGLLSKGPLAVVLVGIPIVLWLFFFKHEAAGLRKFPWWRGAILTVLLAGPWYLLAELKTPGFLDYFIVGEHIRRFLDPGWAGDLYGSAHDQPKGMIWVFWLWASFPWGIVALVGVVFAGLRGRGKGGIRRALSDPGYCFLLASALAPMLFFTAAGNTLWTYALPSLPFTAMLIGHWIADMDSEKLPGMRPLLVGLVPILLTAVVGLAAIGLKPLKTEKELVSYYLQIKEPGSSPLFYLDDLPFSARFYSHGSAMEVSENELIELRRREGVQRLYVAVPEVWSDREIAALLPSAQRVLKNLRYQLLTVEASGRDLQPVSNADGVLSNDS